MAAPGLVLIHSPLLDVSSWHDVAVRLRATGISVVTPDFAQSLSEEPPLYLSIAQSVLKNIADLPGDVVLIGHSGAGALLPVIAAAVGERVRGVLFVDGLLPHPGRSWFDTVPVEWKTRLQSTASSGCLPSWHEWWPQHVVEQMLPGEMERKRFIATLRPRPLVYFEELAPDIKLPSAVRCAYLQLSSGYDTEARQAASLGWLVQQALLGHLAMITNPDALSLNIQELVANLGL